MSNVRLMVRSVCVAWLLLGGGLSDPAQSQELTEVELSTTPWLDGQTGELQPLPVRESLTSPKHRDSRWLKGPDASRGRNQGTPWRPNFSWQGSIVQTIVFWGLVAVLIVTLFFLVFMIVRSSDTSFGGQAVRNERFNRERTRSLEARMEQLPEAVRGQATDLRSQAWESFQQSDLQRAMICLFGHQLLLLDQHALLRLERGKTNRAYLRELAGNPAAEQVLRQTVRWFDASYFGYHLVTAKRFGELWRENERLEAWVRQHAEVTA